MQWRAAFLVAPAIALTGLSWPQVVIVPHQVKHYVRGDGSNSNNGLSNTTAGAWLTIDYAADHALAGDIIIVEAGTYAERVTPAVSGTLSSPITLVANGAVNFCGMDISNKSYIRVIGFTIDTDVGGCTKANRGVDVSGTNTGLEFWNNTIRDANTGGITSGAYSDRHNNFIVIGNVFTAIGGSGNNGTAVSLIGTDNVVAYNEVTSVDPDAFSVSGTHSRWLNNYVHDVIDSADLHSDIFYGNSSVLGLSDNLYEGNFEVGNGALPNEHGTLIQNQGGSGPCESQACGAVTENLFRRNVWHNTSGGHLGVDQPTEAAITNTREVSDTIVEVMRNSSSTAYGAIFNGAGITAFLFNNLNYKAWGASVTSNVKAYETQGGASITAADYNLAYTLDLAPTFTTPWTSQAHSQTNVNPSLVHVSIDDFTLGGNAGVGARGTGGPLTTTSGGGTGTTFNVALGGGGFFRGPNTNVSQYGGNLTVGDVITVGSTTRTISSISADAITVTLSLTWSNGDAVFLGDSTTPDIGAYPYKAGGYSLSATYAISGITATVTPSDASLVRFVVCYEGGIPTTVDNTSPYTCTIGAGGPLVVRVYPLYASKVLWATATGG